MNSFKTLSLSACALLAGTQSSSALYYFPYFSSTKEYRQDASGVPKFRFGGADFFIIDGIYYRSPMACSKNGSNQIFDPDPVPVNQGGSGCTLGATGVLITAGIDLDDDGVADAGYWQITEVDPAQRVEPFRADKVTLYSKPPSTFPLSQDQPLPGIVDNSTFMMYNLQDEVEDNIKPYDVTRYYWGLQYTSLDKMDKEIVPGGEYQFSLPTLNSPDTPFYPSFPITFHHEGYRENGLRGAFRFRDVGRFATTGPNVGFAQYDRRLVTFFRWEGFNSSNLMQGDRHWVSISRVPDGGDASSPAGAMLFPPAGARIQIPITDTEYVLAPGFLGNGVRGFFNIDMERIPANGGPKAVSYRRFQLPIVFVNTFAGEMAVSFPAGTSSASKAKDADPDKDGIPNWIEWLSATDPNKANAPKTLSPMSFVPPSAVRSGEPTAGYWQMTLDRPTALVDPKAVVIEHSTDLKVWTEIAEGDPNWTVIDQPLVAKVRLISNGPELTDKRYFRVKYKYVQ